MLCMHCALLLVVLPCGVSEHHELGVQKQCPFLLPPSSCSFPCCFIVFNTTLHLTNKVSLHALQNSFPSDTVKCSPENSLTLCEGLILGGSNFGTKHFFSTGGVFACTFSIKPNQILAEMQLVRRVDAAELHVSCWAQYCQ